MTLSITGADPSDPGPLGCVVRFMAASAAGDTPAAAAELHPDSREGLSGTASAPPGVVRAEIQEPEPDGERCRVPVRLFGADESEQRFVFVVRPWDGGIGVDMPASFEATFGGDPLQMVEGALRAAVEPLGEAMAGMGEALGGAMSAVASGHSQDGDGPSARRIACDEPAPVGDTPLPGHLAAWVRELELQRRLRRADRDAEPELSCECAVRCVFELDPVWTALACTGVTVTSAVSCEGEDLRPADAREDLGAESYSSWEREAHDCYARIVLAPPRGPCSGLAELTGQVRLVLFGGELVEVLIAPLEGSYDRPIAIASLGLDLLLSRDDTATWSCGRRTARSTALKTFASSTAAVSGSGSAGVAAAMARPTPGSTPARSATTPESCCASGACAPRSSCHSPPAGCRCAWAELERASGRRSTPPWASPGWGPPRPARHLSSHRPRNRLGAMPTLRLNCALKAKAEG